VAYAENIVKFVAVTVPDCAVAFELPSRTAFH